jgi:hypothetical protein
VLLTAEPLRSVKIIDFDLATLRVGGRVRQAQRRPAGGATHCAGAPGRDHPQLMYKANVVIRAYPRLPAVSDFIRDVVGNNE